MRISVGSKNPVKIAAVKELLPDYGWDATVIPMDVSSEISDQPTTLEETIQGAENRAKNAFVDVEYSVGIESGIMPCSQVPTGYLDMCACVIYDGKQFFHGISSLFEYPPKIIELIHQGREVSDAFHELGLANGERLGNQQGAIGLLTKGRVKRKEYTQQAIRTAFIRLENPSLY